MVLELVAFPLVLFLPGYTLINLLFPRKGELDREYDALYRITLGIVMSIVVLVFLGFFLNALGIDASTGLGYFTARDLWVALSALTVTFFVVGWWRGAYPILARVHPALRRPMPREAASILGDLDVDRVTLGKFQDLATAREKLRREVRDADRRVTLHTGSMRKHYEEKRTEAQEKLQRVDAAIQKLEESRAEELY
ncbi:MAG: DUF1616 domain-containing protein [Methanobacteriota archaeon]|nr:MAG: DUF1616 domain-containing protein [Euryarchaeota archaeon]